ncbi:MAG: divergent PAP2 family protein, partial [Oscillospiraceae bacterium]|nr:divergent PAP2 family protein [Oscillospiraceae bacterium]
MNLIILSAVLSWLAAQLIKVITCLVRREKLTLHDYIGTGGMPSSHSAFVCATAFGCGLVRGFDSVEFALGVALSAVVIYDALGIRWQAGLHADAINRMERKVEPEKEAPPLETRLGHRPSEVICGGLLGIF